MFKYLRAISDIFKNYQLYIFQVLFYETIFFLIYKKRYNKFKYLNSDYFSDSIPCPYFFLKKIEDFIDKKNIDHLCDLGSGFGKILFYFGKVCKKKVDGVELDFEIYDSSLSLIEKNIRIFNEDILEFDLSKNRYGAFILNDPLKKEDDLLKLVLRIKREYKKVHLIFINLSLLKQNLILKELSIDFEFKASKNKNIFFCSLN